MTSLPAFALGTALYAAALSLPAMASAQVAPPPATTIDQTFSPLTTGDESPFGHAAIDDGALQAIAGREDTNQLSTATQTAGVSRNSVGDNSVTGDARVSDNAFQNLSGLSILNVNTGNNVAINAAMNVNIAINPGQ